MRLKSGLNFLKVNMMKKILVISGHPNLQDSVANTAILNHVTTALPHAKIRKLDELYPDEVFDIELEQQALLAADIIVWQFPFHWYALPALLKKWLDQVFLHGFSHGSNAKLGGKQLILSFTTGAPEVAYAPNAIMQHSLETLLAPFDSLAALCNLDIQAPVYTTGVSYLARGDEDGLQQQTMAAQEHAQRLVRQIENLY